MLAPDCLGAFIIAGAVATVSFGFFACFCCRFIAGGLVFLLIIISVFLLILQKAIQHPAGCLCRSAKEHLFEPLDGNPLLVQLTGQIVQRLQNQMKLFTILIT